MAMSDAKKARIRKKVRAKIKARTKSKNAGVSLGSGSAEKARKAVKSRGSRVAAAIKASGG